MENKQEILDLLLKALQATRDMWDLVSLDINTLERSHLEIVTAQFAGGGTREINVSHDSGVAMIRDVMNHIDD